MIYDKTKKVDLRSEGLVQQKGKLMSVKLTPLSHIYKGLFTKITSTKAVKWCVIIDME